MKILITHAYAKDNKGDAAILSVLLMQLKKGFPHATVKISTFDDITKHTTFDGFENISSFLYLCVFTFKNPILKMIYAVYIVSATLLWALLFRYLHINCDFLLNEKVNELANEFKNSDLIVP